MTAGIVSGASLGTLSVSNAELENDSALKWVLAMASKFQIKVAAKKKAALSLVLCGGQTLTQRNAILRCLCAMGLQNALDNQHAFVAMGGHSAAINNSAKNAMALAAISSWMSVADQLRASKDAKPLLQQLDGHLATRSFLVPSPSCTIADIDVASALLTVASDDIPVFPNVHRWVMECVAALAARSINTKPLEPMKQKPAVFFVGTEDFTPPKQPQGKQAAGNQQQKGKNKQQQQQANQNNQKGGKKDKGKKNKQPQQKQAPATFTVSALDIRVGKIVKAWEHPESDKLFCEEVDLGEDAPRQIASGLRAFYKKEDLENRRVVVLCNLKKRNLVGFPSHGMVLCASNADHTAVQFMEPPADAKVGERVTFAGFDGNPEPENKVAKKKIFEGLAPFLKTNDEGICVWKEAVSQTSGGPIKAAKGMPGAQVS